MKFDEIDSFSTLLFDFDGTLVDSMPSYSRVMQKILDDFGISYGPDFISVITPFGTVKTAEYYAEEMGVPLTVEEILEIMKKELLSAYLYDIPAKEGVLSALKKLKEDAGENTDRYYRSILEQAGPSKVGKAVLVLFILYYVFVLLFL